MVVELEATRKAMLKTYPVYDVLSIYLGPKGKMSAVFATAVFQKPAQFGNVRANI